MDDFKIDKDAFMMECTDVIDRLKAAYQERPISEYEVAHHLSHSYFYHFQKESRIGAKSKWMRIPKTVVHLFPDNASAFIWAGTIHATGTDKLPRVSVSKEEFETAFKTAVKIIFDNHKE